MEIWKDIKGYEGKYQISNLGNVRALDYYAKTYRGKRLKRAKQVAITDNGAGYKIASLNKENKRKNFYIHRLVAEAFLENPNKFPHVNHKDYNKANNTLENLEWITIKENVRYSLKNKPKTTKRTTKYGKYIKYDKRYGTYNVVVPINGRRTYLGGFKNPEDAMKKRDSFLNNK